MSKFNQLRKSLKANTVVIIENEFMVIDDSIKLLAFYCLSDQTISGKINEILVEKDLTEIKVLIENLKIEFEKLKQDKNLIENIPAIDNFEHYLDKIGGQKILKDFNLERFDKIIQSDDLKFIKNTFLKYGGINTYPKDQYDNIIAEINQIENSEIIFYNQLPTVDGQEDFIKDIKKSVELTESNFYLCLVDKSLGHGEDSSGKDFALNDLTALNKEHKLNSVCFIYTSKPSEVIPPTELAHYYAQEIKKTTPPNFDNITKVLAQSAYATVFDNIYENFKDSAIISLNTVLKNQKNIKHIVKESHSEGIPPYDSIKYWSNLLLQRTFEQNEINNYSYLASLSSFFKNDFLDDHPKIAEIDEEIRNLNNYELFDDNVNIKHLPIAPGDIFKIKNDYYILIGQLCDTLIRGKKLKRNYLTGEMLKIIISDKIIDTKLEVEIKENIKKFKISNFNLQGRIKTLEIEVSTNNTFLIEFEPLDLCCLNKDGLSKINVSKDIEENILKLIPDYAYEYFEKMKVFYKEKNTNKLRQLLKSIDLYNPLLISKIDFERKGKIINYEISRISRLKGRYYDSLYNNILNNKGRIDLNLIDNSNETAKPYTLNFSLPCTEKPIEILNFNLWSSKGREYINKNDLITNVTQYSELLSFCIDDELKIENKTQYELIIEENIIHLQYKYHLGERKYHSKPVFSYVDLFGKSSLADDDTFTLLETGTVHNIKNDKGHPTRIFSAKELEKGICFHQEKTIVTLINGIIKKELNAE